MSEKPIVAIVGRPNVGKSTLFNRLIGERKAIVEDIEGVTRDRLYDSANWAGHDFIVIDTGGIRFDEGDIFSSEIKMQAEIAIDEADVIVFVVSAVDGITREDELVASLLRKSGKPIVLVANKVDNFSRNMDYYEFYNLGLGDPIPISAIHGFNSNDLCDAIIANLPPKGEYEEDDDVIKIAIVGRPNVGKSSLVNALLGKQRVIVSNVAGTTRDSIDTPFSFKGKKYVLIDTAGIRRNSKIREVTEKYSVIRTLRAIERADICLIMLDALTGVIDHDRHIAGYVHEQGKANIIVMNKWDTVEKDGSTMNVFEKDIRRSFKFLDYSPTIYISALTGQRVFKIMDLVNFVADQYYFRIPTGELNRVINEAIMVNPLPGAGKTKGKIFYVSQIRTAPPTFVLFVNDPELIHFSYVRYIENTLRTNFGFEGSPIHIIKRARSAKEYE